MNPLLRSTELTLFLWHRKKYSDKKRLVVDLSAPHNDSENQSLNELISKEEFRLSYIKFEEAIEIIQRLGRYTCLCKTDLHDAFKQLPVREQDWPWLGIFWQDRYYFYTRLVFGCRSSPKIFDTLSQAMVWIAKHNYGISHMLHLLDDFLVLDAPAADADRSMAILTLIMNKLRLPYSKPKNSRSVHSVGVPGPSGGYCRYAVQVARR